MQHFDWGVFWAILAAALILYSLRGWSFLRAMNDANHDLNHKEIVSLLERNIDAQMEMIHYLRHEIDSLKDALP